MEILDDLEERAPRRRRGHSGRRRRTRPRFAIAPVDAARASGECGPAVPASVEFKRRELGALQTGDPGHRAQARHELVEVSWRVQILTRPSLQPRRNPPLRSPAHRAVRPSPIRQNMHAVIIRTGSVPTPWVEDLPANGLNEPPFWARTE